MNKHVVAGILSLIMVFSVRAMHHVGDPEKRGYSSSPEMAVSGVHDNSPEGSVTGTYGFHLSKGVFFTSRATFLQIVNTSSYPDHIKAMWIRAYDNHHAKQAQSRWCLIL